MPTSNQVAGRVVNYTISRLGHANELSFWFSAEWIVWGSSRTHSVNFPKKNQALRSPYFIRIRTHSIFSNENHATLKLASSQPTIISRPMTTGKVAT